METKRKTSQKLDWRFPFSLDWRWTHLCLISGAISCIYWAVNGMRYRPDIFSGILAGISDYYAPSPILFWAWLIFFVIALIIPVIIWHGLRQIKNINDEIALKECLIIDAVSVIFSIMALIVR